MHFGENQLSPSLLGLSPLATGHPPGFQPWWVRASTPSYRRFTLPMARSPRFGSRTCDSDALFGLAFATAPPPGLTSPHATHSQAHSSKGTPSPALRQALTACKPTVSGSISLPSRGTFHPSLTVLVHYRSPGSIQPYQVVLADSRQISGVRRYSGKPTGGQKLSPTGLSPPTVPHSSEIRLAPDFITPSPSVSLERELPQPQPRNP